MVETVLKEFPNLNVIATTLRHAKTATLNDWGALCCFDGQFYEAPMRENLEIYDRVGGGRFLRLGTHLWNFIGKGTAMVGRVRCGAWRIGHDHAGRYEHVDTGGGSASHGGSDHPH